MSNKRVSKLTTCFFVAATALAIAAGGIVPAMAQGQGTAKSAANSQRDKKPAETCKDMDKKSKAYSDCVKTQARTTKDSKQAAQGAEKSKVKKTQ
jgi:hypothetical protein